MGSAQLVGCIAGDFVGLAGRRGALHSAAATFASQSALLHPNGLLLCDRLIWQNWALFLYIFSYLPHLFLTAIFSGDIKYTAKTPHPGVTVNVFLLLLSLSLPVLS